MEENSGIQRFCLLSAVQVLSELLIPRGPKACALNFVAVKSHEPVLYPPGISPPVHCINFGQVSPECSPSAHLDSPHWVDIGCDLKQQNATHLSFSLHCSQVTSHTEFSQSHILNSDRFLNCPFTSCVTLSSRSLQHNPSRLLHL